MKRSTFFKSLLGIAIAPIAAHKIWQGHDEMLKEYEKPKTIKAANKRIWSQIPGTCACISSAWEPDPAEPFNYRPIKPFQS